MNDSKNAQFKKESFNWFNFSTSYVCRHLVAQLANRFCWLLPTFKPNMVLAFLALQTAILFCSKIAAWYFDSEVSKDELPKNCIKIVKTNSKRIIICWNAVRAKLFYCNSANKTSALSACQNYPKISFKISIFFY